MKRDLLILLSLLACPAFADRITLDDGRTLEGRIEPGAEEGSVRIRLEKASMLLPAARVASVTPSPLPREVYADRLREHPPLTPEDQVDLARWCHRKGLLQEAKVHWTAALALDAACDEARAALGYRKVDGVWMSAQDAVAVEKRPAEDLKVAEGRVAGRTADGRLIVEAARKGLVSRDIRTLRVGIPLVNLDIRATVAQLREMRQVPVVSGSPSLSLEAPVLQVTSIHTGCQVAAP